MHYGTPLLVLSLTFCGFAAVNRGHHRQFPVIQTVLRVLVALPLFFSGIFLHFFRTADAASMIPPAFPAHVALVLVTGVLEIAGAIGLFLPRVRKKATLGIVLLMIAVFPANIYAAGKIVDGVQMPGVGIRTLAQVIYILLLMLSTYGLPVLTEESATE
jgi:uncharacterized membrane protein